MAIGPDDAPIEGVSQERAELVDIAVLDHCHCIIRPEGHIRALHSFQFSELTDNLLNFPGTNFYQNIRFHGSSRFQAF